MTDSATGNATGCYGYALRAKALPLLDATGYYGSNAPVRARHTHKFPNHTHTLSRVHVDIPVAPVAISVFKASARSVTLRVPVACTGIKP